MKTRRDFPMDTSLAVSAKNRRVSPGSAKRTTRPFCTEETPGSKQCGSDYQTDATVNAFEKFYSEIKDEDQSKVKRRQQWVNMTNDKHRTRNLDNIKLLTKVIAEAFFKETETVYPPNFS